MKTLKVSNFNLLDCQGNLLVQLVLANLLLLFHLFRQIFPLIQDCRLCLVDLVHLQVLLALAHLVVQEDPKKFFHLRNIINNTVLGCEKC